VRRNTTLLLIKYARGRWYSLYIKRLANLGKLKKDEKWKGVEWDEKRR
jgi:hypothetical protein